MTESAPVDQFKVEAGGGTQLNNGWHVERKTMASLIWLKATVARLMMDSTLFSSPLRFPGFRLTNAIPEFVPAAEAEAVNGKDAFDVGLLVMQVVVGHRIRDLLRALR